ncbi:amidase [Defluviimonas sp. WL0050]|uniref:Amidase n=1 Tax=Albidovulum litorale TaxID=2984134 RepID=A0ABT2ZIG0_9RHOB|nr:amidase [Defluviimonas sp. WL0050]MCV2870817.1 amidase [Defluviimonas sp. WL0050]
MDICAVSAAELSRRMASATWTARAVMEAYLDRIATVNPGLNAIISLRPAADLLAEADAADRSPRRGWLHGMPLAVKDVVATKGLRTTYGSPLHADFVPEADDLIAARMRATGAIFIGKTNTPEWGHGSHSYNPVQGVTRNPYDPTRTAGGSSGGAAAALAARLVPVADGSDTMGSLRNPAAFCNVYGFRPTWGLVPQDAVGDTFINTITTDGPMARSPEDIAHFLEILAGPYPETPLGRAAEAYSSLLDTDIKGKRIGWLGDWDGAYPVEDGIQYLCRTALSVFEDLGARVEPIQAPLPAEELWESWTVLRSAINAHAKRDLLEDPEKRALTKPETLWEIETGLTRTTADLFRASEIRSRWYAAAARLFDRFDALALPSAQVWPFPTDWTWPRDVAGRQMDSYHRWMEIVIPVSLIGLPCLSIPAGFGANSLPMGVQLFGPTGSDARILAMGHAYHRATDWPSQRPPVL